MSKPLLLVGDVHGAHLTLMTLVAKHPERQVVLLGDTIDRGPRSREVVEWAMQNEIPTVGGNHEDLALAYSHHHRLGYRAKCAREYDHDIWVKGNGGKETLTSWGAKGYPKVLPKPVLDWMVKLPPYLTFDMPSKGRRLLASHTGYGLDADKGNWLRALWGRHGHDSGPFTYEEGTGEAIDDGWFRVFGHNRTKEPILTEAYAMVDTGAAYPGYGILTGLLWPEREIVQQAYID